MAIQKYSTKAVIQVDWAKNEACFCQNETHAALFGQNRNSIFTRAIWHRQIKSLAIVSDLNDLTKSSVVANINKNIRQTK